MPTGDDRHLRRPAGRHDSRRRSLTIALLFASAVLSVSVGADGARAATDLLRPEPTFGHQGVARLDNLGPTYRLLAFSAPQVEPDGTTTAVLRPADDAGTAAAGTVVRVSPSGTVEKSARSPWLSEPAVRDANGRWLAPARSTRSGNPPHYDTSRVERFEPDGAVDRSFGGPAANGGWGSEPTPDFPIEVILPLADGAVMVAGRQSVARYLPDGTLDRSFGTEGVAALGATGLAGWSNGEEQIVGLLEEEGGRTIVLASEKPVEGGPSRSTILALDGAGHLDPTAAPPGSLPIAGSITAFTRRPGGGFVVLGEIRSRQRDLFEWLSSSDTWVAAFNADGSPDPGFGSGGLARFNLAPVEEPSAIMASADGSIVVAGALLETGRRCWLGSGVCAQVPFVLRLQGDGEPDQSFGRAGVARLRSLANSEYFVPITRGVLGLAATPGGGLLAVGGSGARAFVARLGARGASDTRFGIRGAAIARAPRPSQSNGEAIAIDSAGRVLVAGETTAGSLGEEDAIVVRFLPDGRRDRSYGRGAGLVHVGSSSWDTPVLVPDRHGGAYLLTSGGFESRLVHLRSDGSVDPRFGTLGQVELPLVGSGPRPMDSEFKLRHAMVALRGGGLLVGGVRSSGNGRRSWLELRRLSPRGHLVRSFGHSGVLSFRSRRLRALFPYDIEAAPDGNIILAGTILRRSGTGKGSRSRRSWDLAVAELTPQGRLDRRFGRGGITAISAFPAPTSARAAATGPGGSIFVAGRPEGSGPRRMFLLRLRADGRAVHRFPETLTHREESWDAGARARTIRQVLVTRGGVFVLSTGPSTVPVYSLDGRLLGTRSIDPRGFGPYAAATAGDRLVFLTSGFTLRAFQVR